MTQSSSKPIYGNCKVLDPNGLLLFRCERRKADWYTSRNLASVVEEEPYTIQLLFQPKGNGNQGEPFYLQERENKCVVCGSEEELTRHHCVPYCYRRHLPDIWSKCSSHDVLAMCIDCHESYETYANELKRKIASDYDAPLEGRGIIYDPDKARIRGLANALLKHSKDLPDKRRSEITRELCDYAGTQSPDLETLSNIEHVDTSDYVYHGQLVCEKLTEESIPDFLRMWREHFVGHMKPKFLPEYWSLDYIPKGVKDEDGESGDARSSCEDLSGSHERND